MVEGGLGENHCPGHRKACVAMILVRDAWAQTLFPLVN